MLKRIALKNFMSHVDTSFDLGPGLNVITGPNNCGKSAIVAAIQLVCRNHLTGDVVARHGTRECSVTLWTSDDHEITWRRKGKDVSYIIDGTEYSRLKGKTPEILHSILKLPEITEGDEAFDLHFGLQKEPIFLLDEAGSKAAKFFASSSDAARLMEMQSAHKARTRERKTRQKLYQEEATQLESQLQALAPVAELRTRTDAVLSDFQKLQDQVKQAEALAYVCHQVIEHDSAISQEKQLLDVTARLPDWPAFLDTEPLEEWLAQYLECVEQKHLYEQRLLQLERLKPPPELSDTRTLAEHLTTHGRLLKQAQVFAAETACLASLTPPPAFSEDISLQHILSRWAKQLEQYKLDQVAVQQTQSSLDVLKAEIAQFASQHPQCPVCQQPWQAEELVKGGHSHG
ncbi:MAG TPA: AAA family ATPase [Gemmatales bacterium]|nr:AAA family ATPase [Gemmatales bacterium]